MSCETGTRKVSLAGLGSGLSRVQGRLAYAGGQMAAAAVQAQPVLSRAGQAALAGVVRANLAGARLVGVAAPLTGMVGPQPQGRMRQRLARWAGRRYMLRNLPGLGQVNRLVGQAQALSGAVASPLAELSQTEKRGQAVLERRRLLFFKSKTPVALWQSRLTPVLNRADLPPEGEVLQNEGTLFKMGRTSWHCGQVTAKINGQTRTVSHLQSLSVPATHYYFNRPLSDEEMVQVAGGQVQAEKLPGFAGQVTALESASPGYSQARKAVIKSYLYYGRRE